MQVSRILSVFFLFVGLLFLVYTTFFSPARDGEIFDITTLRSGHTLGYETWQGSGSLRYGVDRLSLFDTVYIHSNEASSYTSNEDNGQAEISVSNDAYFFDFNQPAKQYVVQGDGFKIRAFSTGKFYLDTRDISQIKIISLSSNLEILFGNASDDTQGIYMFPNQYIVWDGSQNRSSADLDFLRVSQIASSYGYLNTAFFQDQSLPDNLIGLIGSDMSSFVQDVLRHMKTHMVDMSDQYDTLKNIHIFYIPGFDRISEQLLFLKNDTKKVIFYKNSLLQHFDSLMQTASLSRSRAEQVIYDLDQLKSLDTQAYEQMLELYEYYVFVLSFGHNAHSFSVNDDAGQLLAQLKGFESEISSQYPYAFEYLTDTFTRYNFFPSNNHRDAMHQFVEYLFSDIDIKMHQGRIVDVGNVNRNLLSYVSAYLHTLSIQQLLLSVHDGDDYSVFLQSILRLVQDNLLLASYIYFDDTTSHDTSLRQTGLYQNLRFMRVLERFMLKHMFQSERNDKNLLIVHDYTGLKDIIDTLAVSIENMHRDYTSYITLQGSSHAKLAGYTDIQERLDEYFLALSDYDLYRRNYEARFLDVSQTNIYSDDVSAELSEANLINYLSQFSGMNVSSMQVEIIDDEYYRIESLYIQGFRFDFDLYPFAGNRIQNIVVNRKQLTGTYILDTQEAALDEKYHAARGSDRDQYDFKKFFLLTFLGQKQSGSVTFEQDSDASQESKLIIAFKKEKLLGVGREFDQVKGYLPLTWDQVQVSDNYDISLTDVLYVSQQSDISYYAAFNSGYRFSTTSHHFYDITLSVYEDYLKDNGERLAFSGNIFSFEGEIHIRDFNDVSKRFFDQMPSVRYVYNQVTGNNFEVVSLVYRPQVDVVDLVFEDGKNVLEISFSKNQIISIINNTKTVANGIETSTLQTVLDTLP